MTEDGLKLLAHVEALMAEVQELKQMVSRQSDVIDFRAKGAARQARLRAKRAAIEDPGKRDAGQSNVTLTEVTSPVTSPRGTIGGDLSLLVEKKEQKQPPNPLSVTSPEMPKVRQIFAHWQQVWGKQKAELTKDRERRIRARMSDGYAVERLIAAISGSKLDPWEGRREQCDVTQLLKPANIDKFAELWEAKQGKAKNGAAAPPSWEVHAREEEELLRAHGIGRPS